MGEKIHVYQTAKKFNHTKVGGISSIRSLKCVQSAALKSYIAKQEKHFGNFHSTHGLFEKSVLVDIERNFCADRQLFPKSVLVILEGVISLTLNQQSINKEVIPMQNE